MTDFCVKNALHRVKTMGYHILELLLPIFAVTTKFVLSQKCIKDLITNAFITHVKAHQHHWRALMKITNGVESLLNGQLKSTCFW